MSDAKSSAMKTLEHRLADKRRLNEAASLIKDTLASMPQSMHEQILLEAMLDAKQTRIGLKTVLSTLQSEKRCSLRRLTEIMNGHYDPEARHAISTVLRKLRLRGLVRIVGHGIWEAVLDAQEDPQ